MFNGVYNFESPRAAELPQDFVQDILDELTRRMKWIEKETFKMLRTTDPEKQAQRHQYIEQQRTKLNGALEVLSATGLHGVYNWAGMDKRGRYIFPSHFDCEMQEDWIWQCRED